MTEPFNFKSVLAADLPAPVGMPGAMVKYYFVGGNNDPEGIPIDGLVASSERVLRSRGKNLSVYFPDGGPLGDLALREFLAARLARHRGFAPTTNEVLVTTGSNQALSLLCRAFIRPGDTVIAEEHSYAGMLGRMRAHGAKVIGVGLDAHGLRTDHLAELLREQQLKGKLPKFIFTIPTVQNPTATVMPLARRLELLSVSRQYGVPIIEDECYADLLWDAQWPESLRALPGSEHVIHVGSFSKFLAPALRLGFVSAPWALLSQLLSLKDDTGSSSLSQMVVADYMQAHYDEHIAALKARLKRKRDAMVAAVAEHFGETAQFDVPPGGIFLWIRLPKHVDTSYLAPLALQQGIAFNPGAEWSVDGDKAKHCLRLCFAQASEQIIDEGVAKLAQLCQREFDLVLPATNVV